MNMCQSFVGCDFLIVLFKLVSSILYLRSINNVMFVVTYRMLWGTLLKSVSQDFVLFLFVSFVNS
jgi:hypothetical protein